MSAADQKCVIIGASHGGVSLAFELRKRGWEGDLVLVDKDPQLPYHRPPLSKTFLTGEKGIDDILLRPQKSYEDQQIRLKIGKTAHTIQREERLVLLDDGEQLDYTQLVLAVGARPFLPPIKGIDTAKNLFTIRTAQDISIIKSVLAGSANQKVVIIGGGYIGLEAAASLKEVRGFRYRA